MPSKLCGFARLCGNAQFCGLATFCSSDAVCLPSGAYLSLVIVNNKREKVLSRNVFCNGSCRFLEVRWFADFHGRANICGSASAVYLSAVQISSESGSSPFVIVNNKRGCFTSERCNAAEAIAFPECRGMLLQAIPSAVTADLIHQNAEKICPHEKHFCGDLFLHRLMQI